MKISNILATYVATANWRPDMSVSQRPLKGSSGKWKRKKQRKTQRIAKRINRT